jgi:hypothetical protein
LNAWSTFSSPHEADEGINIGGSGFVIGIPCERVPALANLYGVINKRVISSGAIHARLNSRDGKIFEAKRNHPPLALLRAMSALPQNGAPPAVADKSLKTLGAARMSFIGRSVDFTQGEFG